MLISRAQDTRAMVAGNVSVRRNKSTTTEERRGSSGRLFTSRRQYNGPYHAGVRSDTGPQHALSEGLISYIAGSSHSRRKRSGYVVPSVRRAKVAHTRLPSVGFRSWYRFFAVSPQVTWVTNPAVGCHYFPPGLQYPATLKKAATNFAAWWTGAQWVWTVCLRPLPDSVATAIWTRAFLRLSPAR